MYDFIFTNVGEKEFLKLDKQSQSRVISKLQFFKKQNDLSIFLKKLIDMEPATHRLRVGNVRIILKQHNKNTFYILDIGYRGDIYK